MDTFIAQFNAAVNLLFAAGLGWAVLSRAVSDGIVIKAGLIFMALGFGFKGMLLFDGIDDAYAEVLVRVNSLINAGVLIALAGYALRTRAGRRPHRRTSDWVHLDTRPMDEELR